MKFDDILRHVGQFGPYQRRLYFLVCLPAITIAFHGLLPIFILDIPAFRCAIPGLENDTYTSQGAWHEKLLNESVPSDNGKWSECRVYSGNKTSEDINRTTTECHRWVYDTSTYINTAITQLNLVCEKEMYRSHINMINMAGNLVGGLGFGLLSDVIGRKKVMVLNIVIHIAAGVGTAFAENIAGFAFFRFLDGTSNSGLYLMLFGIGMELVGPSKRTLAGIMIDFFWCFGLFGLGGLAYWFRGWRTLTLVCSVPPVLFLSYIWLIPESPRWLLSKGRNSEAEVIIRKIAESNKRELPANMFGSDTLDEGPVSSIKDIFTSPVLVMVSLIIFYNWFVVNTMYYGLSLNLGNLSGDIYLNFTISNIVEAAAYVVCIFLLEKLGRKLMLFVSFITGGVGCVAILFPVIYGDHSHHWIVILINMIGRLGCSSSYAIMFIYSAEVFPTVVRNSGMGAAAFCARLGGVVSPYIADLGLLIGGDLQTALPLLVFGSISLLAGLLTLLLPETLHRQLPETIQDGIHLVKDGMKCCKRRNRYRLDKSCNGTTNKAFQD